MEVVHSSISNNPHLEGLSYEDLNFLRNLAKIYVQSIVKLADENSLPIHKKIPRRPV